MNKANRAVLYFICFVGLFTSSFAATPTFFSEHSQGWHWYHDPSSEKMLSTNGKNAVKTFDEAHPTLAMKLLHQQLNAALDKAILVPSDKNVAAYMELQNKVTERANKFTLQWKHVLLQKPQLDYSIKHPTSSIGREIYLSQTQQKEEKAIHTFAKHNGLFFFYRGDCEYCHRFAPILKAFSIRFGIHVIPVSMGAGFLPEFPNSEPDHGQAARLGVTVTPSLYAVNPTTHAIVPVAYGFMSASALKARIYAVWQYLNQHSEE